MDGEPEPKRGEAAWKEQREAISRRNADAHKRAESERKTRDSAMAERDRDDGRRETELLRELNARIEKRKARPSR